MVIIQKISDSQTFLVRHPVLRAGKTIESCCFDGDDLETTHHFGLSLDGKLVGVISLFQKNNPDFVEINQFQIRGMAVLKQFQNAGYGKSLIKYCEEFAQTQNFDLIWFNARVEAVGFYEKMGYQKSGIPFVIPEVGDHIVMFKRNLK